ncbi:MAG: hydantoinase/oxoprolinase family protein [Planctomycetes bacterium]|nr:hydantoinase/oxoprolinase family protein [Planctomycetota bacterium]
MLRVAVDTGGTFTDAVCSDGRVSKVPSCPADPSNALTAAIAAFKLKGAFEVIHGTTVGTNALLTGSLPPTGLITNEGFEHLLLIGRQARPELYALAPCKAWLPLRREHCVGVAGRLDAAGHVLQAFDAAACRRAGRKLVDAGAQAIAVVLLHSWRNPAHEQAVLRALADLGVPLTGSSDLQREFREVERGTAALLNAALRPVLEPYLLALQERLAKSVRLRIMTSAGGTVAPEVAAQQPVRLLLSGPAGGVVAVAALAREHRLGEVLSLDMGGTSADVAYCAGELPRQSEMRIAGLSVRTPTLAIHTVGAGGGSIASIDAGGLLKVGPASAGADPGPACFGNGGPFTVTDAHLLLGTLAPEFFPEGATDLDRGAAESALRPLAKKLRMSPRDCARGVLRLADSGMVRALRFIGAEQGRDPRGATLLPFGGAGGLHGSSLARALRMKRMLLPSAAGAMSARGLLLAPLSCTRSRTLLAPLRPQDSARNKVVRELRAEALAELLQAGAARNRVNAALSFELRYRGQSFEIEVPDNANLERAFHRLHLRRAGFADPTRDVECVGVRVRLECPVPFARCAALPAARRLLARPVGRTLATLGGTGTPIYDRELFLRGQRIEGPALLCERTSSALLQAGDRGLVQADGSVLVVVGGPR